MINILGLKIIAALGQLKKEGKYLFLSNVTIHDQMSLEIAGLVKRYPPEQN
jgi:hypothetical protein